MLVPKAPSLVDAVDQQLDSGLDGGDATLLIAATGLLVACAMSPSSIDDGPIICPFRALTGLPCPACGMTRSWVYLTHGWLGHAVAANALGVALAVGIVVLGARRILGRRLGLRRDDLHALATSRATFALVWLPWTAFALARIGWYAAHRGSY